MTISAQVDGLELLIRGESFRTEFTPDPAGLFTTLEPGDLIATGTPGGVGECVNTSVEEKV